MEQYLFVANNTGTIGSDSCNSKNACTNNTAGIANDACNGVLACNVNQGNVSIGAW